MTRVQKHHKVNPHDKEDMSKFLKILALVVVAVLVLIYFAFVR
jgi:hypothetical protein